MWLNELINVHTMGESKSVLLPLYLCGCSHNFSTMSNKGTILDMQKSREFNCPKDYPDYKITWARFPLYRDWLNACPSCTDGVMLTDVRDVFFQSGK